ncbi:RdgB/HAM1 family non-canonical purine NTP pyrophosphatase [Jiangella endophytica]|uniref:RdgB/HAM1 family non-canonical purine NTP pyrophosphatase n=1 Tax=Jiangella endophytica TaxID=1623398 RepID=UPI000E347CD3|nr:RdgB/HAM1 family non-canonical purine NTP pyrophosphatase [Jiangella endophytica]
MPKVVLATRNTHKVPEISRILASAGVPVSLVAVSEFPGVDDVEETGLTFAENALLKAHAVAGATGLPALADDSGLSVVALGGMPGVFSARWAGVHGDDGANLRLVLAQLSTVPDSHRHAAFICVAALALPDGSAWTSEGRVDGVVVREPRGSNGFGYDPIFVADGSTRTTAELEPAEKDAISHRGKAFRGIATRLATL